MNSKEALELLFKNVEENFKKRIRIKNYYVPQLEKDCYELIKQDLERLENLEYVLLLIVDYQLINLDELEEFMNLCELEAMQEAFKEVEDKIKRREK